MKYIDSNGNIILDNASYFVDVIEYNLSVYRDYFLPSSSDFVGVPYITISDTNSVKSTIQNIIDTRLGTSSRLSVNNVSFNKDTGSANVELVLDKKNLMITINNQEVV